MSYRVIRPKSHEEWLEERKKGIGSSEAGTIMGVNHFDTAYRLWRRKTGLDGAIESNEAMELGHHLEPAVASLFAARTGAVIDKRSEGDWLAVDTKREYLRVSPDRIYHWPEDRKLKSTQHILECKTSSIMIDRDNVPTYWYCQLQYQMGIMGVKSGALAWISAFPKLHFDYIIVEFNKGFFDSLIEILDNFWNINIQQNIAPEEQDEDDCILKYPQSLAGTVMEADKETMELYDNLKEVCETLSKLEKSKSDMEAQMKSTMGEAETLMSPAGTVLAQWKSTKAGTRFNAKAFQAADPDSYRLYLDPVAPGRRFTLK